MLDSLLKNLNLGDKNSMLINLVASQVQNMGGIEGLVKQFGAKGHGEKAESWVGTGPNQPLSADEAKDVLGADFISQTAQKLGVGEDQVGSAVSQALPEVVDKLTPEGKAPEGGDLMGMIGGLLGQGGGGIDLGQVGGMLGGFLSGDKKD